MSLLREVLAELAGMFLADARLSAGVFIVVAVAWVTAALFPTASPFVTGSLLVVGCLAVLVVAVVLSARQAPRN